MLGLLFLARTDNLFFIGAFMFVWLRPPIARLDRGLVLATILLVAAPWLTWNWVAFGSPIQDSGLATPYVLHESFTQAGYTNGQMVEESAIKFAAFLLVGSYYFLGAIPIFFEATLIFCLLLLCRAGRHPLVVGSPSVGRARRVVIALWVGGLGLVFSHTFIRWFPRTWYFDQLIILSAVTLCLGFTLVELPALFTQPRVRWALLGAMTVIGLSLYTESEVRMLDHSPFPHQVELLDAAQWAQQNLGEEEQIAAFNAGIQSFYSGRRVVNLDGVVNHTAFRALLQKDLWQMLRESGVRYYADYDPMMLRDYSLFLGDAKNQARLTRVQDLQRPGSDWQDSAVRIYRLDWLP